PESVAAAEGGAGGACRRGAEVRGPEQGAHAGGQLVVLAPASGCEEAAAAGEQGADAEDEGAPESGPEDGGQDEPAGGEGERGGWVADGQDGEADGDDVLGEADRGAGAAEAGGVDRESEAGLGAVGDEGGGAGEGGADDAGLDGEPAEQGGAEECRGGRADERVERVPDRVDVADLVHQELDQEEQGGGRDDQWVGEPRELGRQGRDPAEARGEAERRHGGVEVQPGGEGDSEELPEQDERTAHGSAGAARSAAGGAEEALATIADEGSSAA